MNFNAYQNRHPQEACKMSKLKNKVDICYVISHGFAARMLLQTRLIERLTEQGKTVAIITPDASDENFKTLATNERVQIYSANIDQTIWDDDYGVKRRYYLEDIHSNPVFWEKHIYSMLYTKSKHPWKRIRPFIYYPIYRLIPFFPSIRERFKRKESSYLKDQRATDLIKNLNPELVVSTYPINYLESKFLYAAKEAGVRTLIHLLSWDNITSKGIFPVIPDQFIAWGPIMNNELKEHYKLNDDQIHVCGVPHFDQHVEIKGTDGYKELLKDLKLDSEKPYIFVAMSAPRFAPHEIDIVEWLSEAIAKNVFGADLQLVIRPHPQNVQGSLGDKSWLKRLDKLKSDRVAIDYPSLINSKVRWSMRKSDMLRLSNLLAGCKVCLNSGSTVSIDALMVGKPVVMTSFDGDEKLYYWKSARRLVDYIHLKKFTEMGGAKVVYNYEELQTELMRYLLYPNQDNEKREYALEMECYKNDGNSTTRVVNAMLKILARTPAVHV